MIQCRHPAIPLTLGALLTLCSAAYPVKILAQNIIEEEIIEIDQTTVEEIDLEASEDNQVRPLNQDNSVLSIVGGKS